MSGIPIAFEARTAYFRAESRAASQSVPAAASDKPGALGAWTVALTALVVTCLSALTGCASSGGLSLYDATRDKQATTAQTDWKAVSGDAVITSEQTNLKALLAAELSTQDELALAVRNDNLRAFIAAPLDTPDIGLEAQILLKLQELLGPKYFATKKGPGNPDPYAVYVQVVPALDAQMKAIEDWQRAQNARTLTIDDSTALEYERFNLPGPPSCGDAPATGGYALRIEAALKALSPADLDFMSHRLEKLRALCSVTLPAAPATDILPGGLLGSANTAYRTSLTDQAAAKTAEAVAEAAYKSAKDKYDQAVKTDGKSNLPDAKAKVDAAGKSLTSAIKALEDASTLTGGRSDIFISKERLSTLSDTLVSITNGADAGKPDASSPKAVQDVVMGVDLLENARTMQAQAKTPLNLPFQIFRDQQQLKLAAATTQVNARDIEVGLDRQLVETLNEEVHQLWLAQQSLAQFKKKPPVKVSLQTATFEQLKNASTSENQLLLLSAATRYLDVLGRYEAQRYKIEYMRIDAMYTESLAYSAVNVKRWESLISSSVDQVADYYKAGIKPEDWAQLFQAASLVGIAYGVNK